MNAYAYRPMLHNRHNFNIIHGSTSMSNGNRSDDNMPICQICHKVGHAADVCWYRHFDNYVPQPRQFGRGRGHKSAYMANFEPQIGSVSQFEDSFATEYPGYHGYHPPDMNSSVNHHSSDVTLHLEQPILQTLKDQLMKDGILIVELHTTSLTIWLICMSEINSLEQISSLLEMDKVCL